jgi:L-lactate dehydrogenase complex protein LldG
MLARIRSGLEKNRALLAQEAAAAPHAPPPYVHPPHDEDLAELFAAELRKLAAYPHVCADEEEALEEIRDILTAGEVRAAITWDDAQIRLGGLDALLGALGVARHTVAIERDAEARAAALQQLEAATACISGVDAGIAESATLMLHSGPGRPRLASLLAPIYIAVVRREQLVRGLGEAIARLKAAYTPDLFAGSSALTLITGPSRTADIEMTLALGVHGPREIHVVII